MKTFKKILAAAIAVGTMATSMLGMSASAYSPTISRSFSFDNATVTGTLYRDSSKAYGTTSSDKSFYKLTVKVTWGSGESAYGSTTNGKSCNATKKTGSGTASSIHYAYKDSVTKAYTTIYGV